MKVSSGPHSFLKARILLFQTLVIVGRMQSLAILKLGFLFVCGCQLQVVLRAICDFLPHVPLPLGTLLQHGSSLLEAQQENLSLSRLRWSLT